MGTSGLPMYNSSPLSVPRRGPGGITFRLREKYLILVAFGILAFICFSTFIFLPAEDIGKRVGAAEIKQKVRDVFNRPDQLVMPLPLWARNNQTFRQEHHDLGDEDPHRKHDESLLKEKIDQAQIPAPNQKPKAGDESIAKVGDADSKLVVADNVADEKAANAVPEDAENVRRRDKIRSMMKFAWDGYKQYAWGTNELKPASKSGHSASIFGSGNIGATIIDALDTLYIMGLKDEFADGQKWVEMSFDMKSSGGDLSVFETNIRFVGGLLSAYALTKEPMFRTKAQEVADLLLPAFNTPTGIPMAMINVQSGNAHNWGWASGGASILSEFGTLHLEFEYLSAITGKAVYAEKVARIRQVLNSVEKPDGLYPNYLNPKTGKWGQKHVSMGALGDSFYEYLLKSWLITNKRDVEGKRMYDETMAAMERQMIVKSKNGLTYFAEMKGSHLDHKMDHLACFIVGLFAIQAVNEPNKTAHDHWMHLAREIGNTCHESYIRTDTGIGPESFRFTNEFEAITVNERDKYYILRPEVIEGWFYLWRTTKDPKYREWCWAAAESIEKYCKAEAGYAGIRNVYTKQVAQDDVQQSFFLAETLKYLYLAFTDDSVIPLDKWVFNTEAHPMPVRPEVDFWQKAKEDGAGAHN